MLDMVYIRAKKVKGIDYAYLVKSEWDGKNKTSKQVTIKYLGRASDVDIEEIPTIYREDPKIVSFLSKHNPRDVHKKKVMVDSLRTKLFDHLSSGDVNSALELYKEIRDALSIEDFFDKIFRPVMFDIGAKWEKGELDIVAEHVSSNAAQALIAMIEQVDNNNAQCNGRRILICCPDGELHHMPALVLESILKGRGYSVLNASPSVPAGSILNYVDNNKPELIMLSVTLPENVGAAKRIVRSISERFGSIPILVGGSAFANSRTGIFGATVVSPDDNSLEDVLRLVRSSLKGGYRNSPMEGQAKGAVCQA